MGRRPHVLVVPYPVQGHVKPLMSLAHRIADYGIKVTLVNSHSTHSQITAASPDNGRKENRIALASTPDVVQGQSDEELDASTRIDNFKRIMSAHLKDLIRKIDDESDDKVSFVIADAILGWILQVPREMGIPNTAIWPGGPGSLLLLHHIPNLIEQRIIDTEGATLKSEEVRLIEGIPGWSSSEFSWSCPDNAELQKLSFWGFKSMKETSDLSPWLLCNTFEELHPEICRFIPNMLPVGPLLAGDGHNGSLCKEDRSSLTWLDGHSPSSVVYISFGSTSIFTQHQFDELALGLELAGRPFLWVVRPNLVAGAAVEYPDGFRERVAGFGMIVEWAPQEEVLRHPSVASFFSHCGWNSTVEGLCSGVPFLCWPYFTDQFHNREFICEKWKVGLKVSPDHDKVVSRHEVRGKIEKLLADKDIKENALKLKEIAMKSVSKGGSSLKNLENFIQSLKG